MMFRYQRLHWFYGVALTLVLCASWFGAPPEQPTKEKLAGLLGATVVFTALITVLLLVRRMIGSRSCGTLGDHFFDISADHIAETNPHGRIETYADGIRSVDETPVHFFVIAKTGYGHVIPKAALNATDEIRALQAAVRARKA